MDLEYESLDMDNKLIRNLRDLGHMIRFLFEGRGSQKRILILLYESEGSMTQRELTERLGIQPGSVSEVVQKLENAGLVRRAPNLTDRRTSDIQLTPSGLTQAKENARQRRARHQEMFACLSEEEKDTLLRLLEKLNLDWNGRYREKMKQAGGSGHHCHGHR